MDEKFKIAGFVVIFFIAIFSTDFLDNSLKSLMAQSEWWNLVVATPLLIVTIGTGFYIYQIKSLIKFAFLGALCLFIFVATQNYFAPDAEEFGWSIFHQSWLEIGAYLGFTLAAMFLGVLVFLCLGGLFRYMYNLFFVDPKSEITE
jgi:hypothetical protein